MPLLSANSFKPPNYHVLPLSNSFNLFQLQLSTTSITSNLTTHTCRLPNITSNLTTHTCRLLNITSNSLNLIRHSSLIVSYLIITISLSPPPLLSLFFLITSYHLTYNLRCHLYFFKLFNQYLLPSLPLPCILLIYHNNYLPYILFISYSYLSLRIFFINSNYSLPCILFTSHKYLLLCTLLICRNYLPPYILFTYCNHLPLHNPFIYSNYLPPRILFICHNYLLSYIFLPVATLCQYISYLFILITFRHVFHLLSVTIYCCVSYSFTLCTYCHIMYFIYLP